MMGNTQRIWSRRISFALLALALTVPTGLLRAEETTAGVDEATTITSAELRPHIEYLAGPKLAGRNNGGAVLAARYVAQQFMDAGLEPLFETGYFQAIPDGLNDKGESRIIGQNVGGIIWGSDETLRHEILLINAHYDHLGTRGGKVYPGADDNASGVSMLLETARHIAAQPVKPRRSIAFVAFDLEEYLLWGSRWFVAHPPVPLERIKLCLTADMIGRSLGGLELPTVFVVGSESSSELRDVVFQADRPEGLETALLGVDLIGTRSDYGPFRDQEIPFLFFSTGEHPDYHTENDTIERLNIPKAARVSTFILALIRRIADLDESLEWQQQTPLDLNEARSIHRITELLLEADDNGESELTDVQRFFVSQVNSKTGFVLQRGKISAAERTWLARSAQLLLLSVF